MNFRRANKLDKDKIMEIIKQAKSYFKLNNINQWQNGYPNEAVVLKDIENKESYLLLEEDDIVATAVISLREEPTYNEIFDGSWLSKDKYLVIHRFAVRNDLKGKGIANNMIKLAEKLALENNINSIKIDTHEENLSMKRVLEKNGFTYCGVIYLEDKSKRIAFEKNLNNFELQ